VKKTGTGSRLRAFLRSFLIQGSWNYRTMLGGGFAFAILPVLKRLYRDDPEGFRQALQRHSEHFNAHPYLADLALGATCRMEEEGRDPEEIRRFKVAVRGPLGSLGDALVWVGWRPATVLVALALALAGAPPWVVVVTFLGIYNAGHLFLRIWGFRQGLERSSRVGDALRYLALPRQADRLAGLAALLLGGVGGLALARSLDQGPQALLWAGLAGLGVWAGSRMGERGWSPGLWGTVVVTGVIFLFGWFA